jgi:hypothetical protein
MVFSSLGEIKILCTGDPYYVLRPGIEPGLPLKECGRSTIEQWNLNIVWVASHTLCPRTSLQMPNIEMHRPGIEPGPPLIECGLSTIELWNLYIIWVC